MLSGEELLAGSGVEFSVPIPGNVLNTDASASEEKNIAEQTVRLRPLTVNDLQLIARAAKENDSLTATLMVKQALIEPEMSVQQVSALHVGLMQFLLQKVNEISGISASTEQLNEALEAPLTKAAFILAKEFGWTPQQVNELTLGQILLNLHMLRQSDVEEAI